MWKVLLVIASIVLAGSAWLSYDNMGALQRQVAEGDAEKQTLEARKSDLAKANEAIGQFEQSIAALTMEAETLQNAKIDADAKALEIESNLKAQQGNLETAKTKLDEAKELVKDIHNVESINKEMVQIRTQIEEAEIEVTQLEGAVASAQVERDRLEKVAAELAALRTDQEAGVIRGEFQSQIKKAYNQWGFVVVEGGFDQGIVNRAQLDVYRRGQPICRLLVTSVEAGETVADIVSGSLAPGQSVQVGDTVVKSVRAQTPAVIPASAPAGGVPAAPASAPADAGMGGEAAPAPAAAPDPFGGAPATAPPATTPDPFGGSMEGGAPAPAPASPDPFGSPAPQVENPAPAPDPFQ